MNNRRSCGAGLTVIFFIKVLSNFLVLKSLMLLSVHHHNHYTFAVEPVF